MEVSGITGSGTYTTDGGKSKYKTNAKRTTWIREHGTWKAKPGVGYL